jgi:hypothetical protein
MPSPDAGSPLRRPQRQLAPDQPDSRSPLPAEAIARAGELNHPSTAPGRLLKRTVGGLCGPQPSEQQGYSAAAKPQTETGGVPNRSRKRNPQSCRKAVTWGFVVAGVGFEPT